MNAYQISVISVTTSTMTIGTLKLGWRVKGHLKLKTSSSDSGYELLLLVEQGKT